MYAEVRAVCPARALDLVRPAGAGEPRPQVVEDGVVDMDLERLRGSHPHVRRAASATAGREPRRRAIS